MNARYCRFLTLNVRSVTAVVALLATSCAPQYSTPQQVRANNPSVTYKYHNDQELLQVNQSAAAFCTQYNAGPRPTSFANDPDGGKVVVFECLPPMAPVATSPQFNPNLAYTYRTDAELLEASRSAQSYCMNNGSQQVISNIATDVNGNRTVVFQCSRP